MQIGRVKELWRYPVKSMQGERVERVDVTDRGLPGDRAWAVRDEVNGGIRGAKKLGALMQCAARYLEEPTAKQAGAAEITLPNGDVFGCDAADAAERISAALGHQVTLWPLMPADQLDHYRRGASRHPDMEQELREMFALLPDEPLPDLSALPPELMEYESPPGTYFDAFPMLVMTDASLTRLQTLTPESRIDVRRFRPNIRIEVANGESGFVETKWVGKHVRVGDVTLEITANCPRCVMTTRGFADFPKDPNIMRTLVRENTQNLGVYATVGKPGTVKVGDPVVLKD